MANLGFIGIGIMGQPMAGRLLAAGHAVATCIHKNPAPVQALAAQGATVCGCFREVAARSAILFLMVPDTPDVEAVLFGPEGAAEGLQPGSVVVDMSTISPIATQEFAKRLEKIGVEMLDAPVSGGDIGAVNGTLSIMVGGKPEVFERVKPYFQIMGKNIVLVGGHGSGQVCKAANQIVIGVTLEAVGEALLLAAKAGVDPEKVREALLGGFAQSRVLEVHGERMIRRTFKPGFKVHLHQKDLNIVLQVARALGLSLPGTALAAEMLNSTAAQGGAELDDSALVMALEALASYRIGG